MRTVAAGEATKAAERCFSDWIRQRDGIEPMEERTAVAAVRYFIELHGNSRFEPMHGVNDYGSWNEGRTVQNRVGFRRADGADGVEHIILPEVWKREVCVGFDAVMAARTLARHGYLKSGGQGKSQCLERLPGYANPVRCYVVKSNIFDDGGREQKNELHHRRSSLHQGVSVH